MTSQAKITDVDENYARSVIIEIFEKRNLSGRTADLALAISDLTNFVDPIIQELRSNHEQGH